jgi:hypothetical protein
MPVEIYRYDGTTLQPDLFTGTGAPITVTTGRDSLIPEAFFPNATNTGHITPTGQMAVVSGNVSWDSEHDGATITKTRFTGRLTLNTQNITFKDCIFEGYIANSTTSFCVWPNGIRCLNIKFIDCTFKPAVPDHGTHIIMGHHFTLTRCDLSGGVDGVSVVAPSGTSLRADVRVEGSWIHDLAYFSPDSFHNTNPADNQTHNDSVQWGAGIGFAIVGSRVEGFADPTIGDASTVSSDSGTTHLGGNKQYPNLAVGSGVLPVLAGSGYPALGEFVCLGNWFSGGSIGLNVYAATAAFTTNDGSIIDRNKFGYDWLNGVNDVIYLKSGQVIQLGTNYRWGSTPWLHGDAETGLTHNEDTIDPWDLSTPLPAAAIKRFA